MKRWISAFLVAALAAMFCIAAAGCAPKATGTFYSLKGAYEEGLLSYDDLMSIAYHHNGGRRCNETVMAEGYAPKPKDPQELDDETSSRIRNTAAYDCREEYEIKASADDFTIIEYCGTYNDCVAVMMTDKYFSYTEALEQDVIADIVFSYNNGNKILIWKADS